MTDQEATISGIAWQKSQATPTVSPPMAPATSTCIDIQSSSTSHSFIHSNKQTNKDPSEISWCATSETKGLPNTGPKPNKKTATAQATLAIQHCTPNQHNNQPKHKTIESSVNSCDASQRRACAIIMKVEQSAAQMQLPRWLAVSSHSRQTRSADSQKQTVIMSKIFFL